MKEEDGTFWRSNNPTDPTAWEYFANDTWERMDEAPELTSVYTKWVKDSCAEWVRNHTRGKK